MARSGLTRSILDAHIALLADRVPVFAAIVDAHGAPPLWRRPESFRTLVEIVNEQKISLASARAIGLRVAAQCVPFSATRFLTLPDMPLRAAGMSVAKIGYCRSIAQALLQGDLVLAALRDLDDASVRDALVAVRGIGPWTAGVYLTMALGRADAWPSGDRALAVGAAEAFALDSVPDYQSLDAMAEAWRPHRGTASRLIWHAYLRRRGMIG